MIYEIKSRDLKGTTKGQPVRSPGVTESAGPEMRPESEFQLYPTCFVTLGE